MLERGLRFRLGWTLWLGVSLATQVARAEVSDANRAAARELGSQGVKAYQAGDYAAALAKLDKAYALTPAPSLRLWQARALAKQGKLLAASEHYLAATRIPLGSGDVTVQQKAQEEAARERAELLPRIPGLTIVLDGASAEELTLSLDGQAIAAALVGENMPVDPGERVVVGVRGAERVEAKVKLEESERKSVTLRFTQPAPAMAPPPVAPSSAPPAPAPAAAPPAAASPVAPPATQPAGAPPAAPVAATSKAPFTHTLGWVGVGLGGAGVVLGSITGALVLSRKGDLENGESCRDFKCAPSKSSDVDSFNTLRTVSGVGFVAGGVLLAAGVGLLLIPVNGSSDASSTTLLLGPTGATVRGTF